MIKMNSSLKERWKKKRLFIKERRNGYKKEDIFSVQLAYNFMFQYWKHKKYICKVYLATSVGSFR
jgi:hypothetical protein